MDDNIIIKECPKHGLTEHVLMNNGTYKCKSCRAKAVENTRRNNKKKLVEYKGGKCEICGYDKCIDALEFHHLNPNEKEFGLSNGDTKALSMLKKEADKCILVCSNCHREIHYKQRIITAEKTQDEETNNELLYFQNNKTTRKTKSYIKNTLSVDDIVTDIKNGLTKKEIAKKYSIGLTTLKRFLIKNNIFYSESQPPKLKDLTITDFCSEFKEIKSFVGVAKKYNVTDKSLQKWCQKNGLPWRKNELIEYVNHMNDEKEKPITDN